MAKMKTGLPAQKVTFATAAAAAASVFVSMFTDTIPGLEAVKVELITVVTFLAGYLMPPSENDAVVAPTKPKAE